MNIQKYLTFLKVVELGSFTKAAAALNYSQSAVSRMITDLEKEWDTVLLERSRSGAAPTSTGTVLLPHIQTLCREYQNLKSSVDEVRGLQSGLIRIGTFSSVATHWLPPIIREFRKKYPRIDYELLLGDYDEIEGWIRTGRVDCGFLRLPAHKELDAIFLERDRLLAVLPEKHPLAGRRRFPVAALAEGPFLLLEKGARADILDILDSRNIRPKVQLTTYDDYAIMSMVENGLGISVLPELILRRAPYRIVTRELDVPAYRRIGLAMRSRENAPPAVKRFLDYLPFRNSPMKRKTAR